MTANRLLNDEIVIHGAREHNLRDVTVRMPRGRLVCITGLSGSGKSSLAFDTLYAEGQRRYVESLSAYARQFLGQMDKPDVDSIEGLSPAISIDQKTTSRNPRSTVGTVTEVHDYLRLLFARIGRPHCPICGRPIAGQSAEQIVDQVLALPEGTRFTIDAPLVRGRKGEHRDVLESLRGEGFTRVRVDGETYLLDDVPALDKKFKHDISAVVDRLVIKDDLRQRLNDSIETALRIGDGLVEVREVDGPGAHLLREVRVPRARRLAGRARAAHVLVQLAARRLPGLHRPRRDARGRSRAGRARSGAVDPRGRARALERGRLELLRAGARGDRRSLGGAARPALGRALARASGPVPERHRQRARVRDLQEPLRAQALVHDRLRGRRREPAAPLPRDAVAAAEGAHRDVHVDAAVLGLRRGAAAARGARGDGRRPQHRLHLAPCGARGARVLPRARADRHGAPDRRARDPRDPGAPDVPRRRGRRLPLARPRGAHALGRRGAAHPARDADRREPRGRALHPRRAVDRPAPARQRAADRDARAPARHRQHGDRRRARRGDDALGRLGDRHGPGRGRARRAGRRRGHGGRRRRRRRGR